MQARPDSEMLQRIEQARIVAILRGDFTGMWRELGAALIEGGLEAIEVTFNSPNALGGIKQLRMAYEQQAVIGAGTVMTPEQVDAAIDSGAQYIIAPNTNPAVIKRCLERGVLVIPGAYTPTEIEYAYRLGAGMVKLFPAMPAGPSYVKNLRGPYPHIPLMATGGVEIDVINDFLKAGANAIGVGSPLIGSDALEPRGLDKVRDKASRAMNATHKRVT